MTTIVARNRLSALKKKEVFKILDHDPKFKTCVLVERFGVSPSTIKSWKQEYAKMRGLNDG